MAKLDPSILSHLEWLGFVQPTGLVVSPSALVQAGAILPRSDRETHQRLREVVSYDESAEAQPFTPVDFSTFATDVLGWGWSAKGYSGTGDSPIPESLQVHLPDYEETLIPDHAVKERDPADDALPWQLLVRCHEPGTDLDKPYRESRGTLEASPQGRLERLLRRNGVPAGLLYSGETLRLVSAPYGESSGWLDFRVGDMVQGAGRPICAALKLLLSEQRLLALPKEKRLAALLVESRKYQNTVSETLAEQVLHALYELMRGLQSAHDKSGGKLLEQVLRDDPDEVYRALLHVILRLVFLLYAEEREMLPSDETFLCHYSVAGLHDRLRSDAALHPDTMDDRYGAFAQLVGLFRLIHDGASSGSLQIPPRHGVLFDPDRFPFLEGRSSIGTRQMHERIEAPLVPDGAIYRALEKLLILDGERISYRALDVEQIGSVYETMMGFRIEKAEGMSVAIKAQKKGGAPTTINLDALLEVEKGKRAKWVKDQTDRKLTATVSAPVKDATSIEELHAALDKVIDRRATPDLTPAGSLVLQPSEARRKSGSHYTPRELTEPIVRTTLKPILERLREEAGGPPTPEQILELKVCDPAMGSGAFLVESCRHLGDALIEAWNAHDQKPQIPVDEDEVVHARRLIAQRCIYGVDRNPVAVDLAKVSLWLATLAKDHAFTFVDHALRHGDSLVGLTNAQIADRNWTEVDVIESSERYKELKSQIDRAMELRRQIREAGDEVSDFQLRDLLDEADHLLDQVRTCGDLVIEAFFKGKKPAERRAALQEAAALIASGELTPERLRLEELRREDPPLAPFHWELEYPEVFDRDNGGFDVFVGNPPFLGGNKISGTVGKAHLDWFLQLHVGSCGGGDLVAHFFRRAFDLLRKDGVFGLIATNTIRQGDTRNSGLRWICEHGGQIYEARRRVKWPGLAAVIVSVVHVKNGLWHGKRQLDERIVDRITAFLFHRGGDKDPESLQTNIDLSFQGSNLNGVGFTFEDGNPKANPTAVMESLLRESPKNSSRIFPYLGGKEVNTHPQHLPHRYVISFGEMEEAEAKNWPELFRLVEERVKPGRAHLTNNAVGRRRAQYWWQFASPAAKLYQSIQGFDEVLVSCQTAKYRAFAIVPGAMVYGVKLVAFSLPAHPGFAILQSSIHEIWSLFFGSTFKDDPVYTKDDCFETFPFPENWQTAPALEVAGKAYYGFRADLMVRNGEGLTNTYNRFHDPNNHEPDIVKLRVLHAAMDRAVLNAYGWDKLSTDCEYYEVEEDRKIPWRYRWPDDVRDEVLARLLELNAQRAAEEREGVPVDDQGELFT